MSRTNRLFINKVENCVDEMLESIAMQNPGLCQLQGHRVIIREDAEHYCNSNHVSLISGGGSGHEPFAGGFVGQGMLTAAVAGSVFASPPPADIIAAIEATRSPSGTLLIVANYTGDRINFGIALERAKSLGHTIKMVVVGEDCALESSDKTAGRRGLVGIVNVMKVAGCLSEEGKSLDEIVDMANLTASSMGTIGVSLTGCSIPGSGSSFKLHESEMELGLGAHGEAGIKRMKIQSADDTVVTMIQHMSNARNASSINLMPGTKVAVTINNLGGISSIEMHILARKVIKVLEEKEMFVERFYFGHLMTSLDMCGFNLNIIKLTDKITACLDASTNAPGWPRTSVTPNSNYSRRANCIMVPSAQTSIAKSVTTDQKQSALKVTDAFLQGVKQACDAIILKEKFLNELDTASGDGDCGSTLKRGALQVLSKLQEWKSLNVSCALLQIASCAELSMGGASGGLYSLFFTAASHSCSDATLHTWKKCIDDGMLSIMKYGKAELGDRTMVDALSALTLSLTSSMQEKKNLSDAFKCAAVSVNEAAVKTSSMKARAGRASYVASEHLKHPDPGAMAVAIFIESISNFLNSI